MGKNGKMLLNNVVKYESNTWRDSVKMTSVNWEQLCQIFTSVLVQHYRQIISFKTVESSSRAAKPFVNTPFFFFFTCNLTDTFGASHPYAHLGPPTASPPHVVRPMSSSRPPHWLIQQPPIPRSFMFPRIVVIKKHSDRKWTICSAC